MPIPNFGNKSFRLSFAFATTLGLCLVIVYAAIFGPLTSPWMGDAGRYIEATRSLLRGEPLLLHGSEGASPMALWPPGYPLLGGLVALTGMPAQEALLFVTRLSLAACAPAAVWAAAPAIGNWPSILTGVLCLTAPGLFPNANLVSTDAVFCLVSILAAGSVVRGHFLLAGCMIGAALCVRNSGIALGLAAGIVVLWDRPIGYGTLRDLARLALGALPPVAALMTWNVVALGSLTPYSMAPSTFGLARNLADVSAALVFDFIPAYGLAHAVPWGVVATALAILMACTFAMGWLRATANPVIRRFALFAACYVAIGLAMTVYARTRYQWGEPIWERHTSQYDWLLIPAALATGLLGTAWMPRSAVKICIAAALLTIAIRGAAVVDRAMFFRRTAGDVARIVETGVTAGTDPLIQMRQMFRSYERVPALATLVGSVNPACRIESNIYDLLNAAYDLPPNHTPVGVRPTGPAVFVQAALSGDPAFPPAPAAPIAVPGMPAGLRVFSDNAGVCLPTLRG